MRFNMSFHAIDISEILKNIDIVENNFSAKNGRINYDTDRSKHHNTLSTKKYHLQSSP